MAKGPASLGVSPPYSQTHERQVADALTMLDYAIASGAKTVDGHAVSQDIIKAIETTASKLGLFDDKSGGAKKRASVPADDWAAFDVAYYDLATALAPVTAETLRSTAGQPPSERSFYDRIRGDSPALRFTRALWWLSIAFAAFAIAATCYLNIQAVNTKPEDYLISRTILEMMTPWAYGGLGACVYLLRSAHTYIYQRTFDIRRKPEYFNRILLGTISGGAIIMFANYLINDDDSGVKLGTGALGFLAGYNTDLLFTALERITKALLPKTDDEDNKDASGGTKPVDVNDLAEKAVKAKPADKAQINALIAHVTGMRTPVKGK